MRTRPARRSCTLWPVVHIVSHSSGALKVREASLPYMSTQPIPEESPLKLHHPGDVLAAVPFVLGFEPANSLVAISLRGRRQRVGLVMRADYPAEADLELFEHAALNMVTHLQRDEARGVILIAYPPECILDPAERPVDEALAILERAAFGAGIDVREALLVTNARWWSTRCNDGSCCPLDGTPLAAIGESRVAAEVVVRGGPMPFACEGDLIASLAHSDSLLAQCLEQAIAARVDELIDQSSKEELQDIRSRQRAALDECFSLWCQSQGNTQLFAGKIRLLADVVIGIQGIMLRDYALGIHSDESVDQAMTLWRWLLTLAPMGTVAPVACLTAATAYELGDGALAQRALDRAFLDSPEYSLAHLLRRVFTAGLAPETFARMRDDLHSEIANELKAG
jgi:hypothetical protein